MEKTCKDCGDRKDVEMFHKSPKNTVDGRQAVCKACSVLRNKRWRHAHPEAAKQHQSTSRVKNATSIKASQKKHYDANPEKMRERRAKYSAENPGWGARASWRERYPDKQWLRDVASRARKNGIGFDPDISDIVVPEVCPILGIPLLELEE
jgi:hypothetical protein